MTTTPLTLGVNEAAAYAGIGRHSMRRLVRSGAIPSFTVGRRIRIPREGVEQFIAQAVATHAGEVRRG
jgi:excisionase family DNA binding protein